MKTEDILLLGAVGLAMFWLIKAARGNTAGPAADPAKGAQYTGTKLIMQDKGWQYFTDGTAIGPDGRYYHKGQEVYDPLAMYRNAF